MPIRHYRGRNEQSDDERDIALSWRVEKWLVKPNESYPVGAALGYLHASPEDAARLGLDALAPAKPKAGMPGDNGSPSSWEWKEKSRADGARFAGAGPRAGASYMSPRMKARMNELGLHAADLAGSREAGHAGRVTIQDLKIFCQPGKHKLTPASSMRVAVADPCAGAGRVRWLPWRCRCAWIRCLAHRKKFQPQNPARRSTRCGQWPSRCRKTARPRAGWSATKLFIRQRLTLVSRSRPKTDVLVPVIRHADKTVAPAIWWPVNKRIGRIRPANAACQRTRRRFHWHVTNSATFGLDLGRRRSFASRTLGLGMGAGRRRPSLGRIRSGQFVTVIEANSELSSISACSTAEAAGRLPWRVVAAA